MGIGLKEVLIILLVVVILFGGRKIPELMKGLGQGIRNFKDEMNKPGADKPKEGGDKGEAK